MVDYAKFLSETPDITTKDVTSKEKLFGTIGDVVDATKKLTATMGSYVDKAKAFLNKPIFNSLKNIAGKLAFNGEGVYDPTTNAIYISGLKLVGVVDCVITMPESFSVDTGLAGETVVSRRNAPPPKMTLTLLRTSPSNRALKYAQAIMLEQRKGSLIITVHENGEMVFQGTAVLTKLSDISLDSEGADNQYTFQFV